MNKRPNTKWATTWSALCAALLVSRMTASASDASPATDSPPAVQTPVAGQAAATATPPGVVLTNTPSTWAAVAYGITSLGGGQKHYGGGIAGVHEVTPSLSAVARFDYYNGTIWMPSMSLQLQTPVKFTIGGLQVGTLPFAFTGIATALGQPGTAAVSISGAGLAVRLGKNFDILGDIERWSAPFNETQLRLGIAWRF